jgi:alkylation response protein AidB-like acyl-CoA dehydrogenase
VDFSLTDEQEIASREAVRFARDELNPHFVPDGADFPRQLFDKFGEFGCLGAMVPAAYGGADQSGITTAVVYEALGYACADHGLLHAAVTQMLCASAVAKFGSDQQRQDYLPGLCRGSVIASQAITEPDAGSDTSQIRTMAALDGDAYVVSGSKVFISNAPVADIVLLFAVTDQAKGFFGHTSCFLLKLDSAGVSRGVAMRKMGLDSLQNGELFFDDVRVPRSALLGNAGNGGAIFSDTMTWERILLFATVVGKMQRVLESTIEYAKSRKQSGKAIASHQAVSHKIADMRVNLELSRLAVYQAAWLKDQGKNAFLEASIAKLFASESCRQTCIDALQIHGGYGYMKEYEIERELRDAFAGTIYSGTSEIQRNIIARLCGL